MPASLSIPGWRLFARRVWAVLKSVLLTVLIFTLIGPAVGYFAVLAPVAGSALPGPEGIVTGLLGVVALMPAGIPFAYLIGYLPAALTGLALALVDLLVDLQTFRIPAAIALGALVTVALLHATVGRDETGANLGYLPFAAVAGATGAIAAAVCALLAPRRGLIGPVRLTGPANSATNKP